MLFFNLVLVISHFERTMETKHCVPVAIHSILTCNGPEYSNQYLISSGGVLVNKSYRFCKSFINAFIYDGDDDDDDACSIASCLDSDDGGTCSNRRWSVVDVVTTESKEDEEEDCDC